MADEPTSIMEGLLIFDQQGDVIFSKLNVAMRHKIRDMARRQELIAADSVCYLHIFVKRLVNEIALGAWIVIIHITCSRPTKTFIRM